MPATRSRSPRATTSRAPTSSTFLDITATSDERDLILHIIEAVASQVFIPLTVGGGVRTVDDVRRLLNAGADKVSFNSAAVANPERDRATRRHVRRAVHRRRDRRQARGARTRDRAGWDVYTHGGRTQHRPRRRRVGARMAAAGAGEILLTSMDRDGTKAASTSRSRARSASGRRAGDRVGRRRRRSSTWRTASASAAPTRCWPRASSTTASSRSREAKALLARDGIAVRPVRRGRRP